MLNSMSVVIAQIPCKLTVRFEQKSIPRTNTYTNTQMQNLSPLSGFSRRRLFDAIVSLQAATIRFVSITWNSLDTCTGNALECSCTGNALQTRITHTSWYSGRLLLHGGLKGVFANACGVRINSVAPHSCVCVCLWVSEHERAHAMLNA